MLNLIQSLFFNTDITPLGDSETDLVKSSVSFQENLSTQVNLDSESDVNLHQTEISQLLSNARSMINNNEPSKALEQVIEAIRLSQGEDAILQTLDFARTQFSELQVLKIMNEEKRNKNQLPTISASQVRKCLILS